MTAYPVRTAILLAAVLGPVACSKASGGAAAGPTMAGAGQTQNACLEDLKPRDVAAILGPSGVTVKPVPSNPEACRFEGSNSTEVMVGLRSGDEVEPFWKLTVTRNNNRMIPMAGVGEAALRLPDGSEVMAREGALSCQADVMGVEAIPAQKSIKPSQDDLARRLGGLCNKVFASHRA